MRRCRPSLLLTTFLPALLAAQGVARQTESDAYTRYELLSPGSAKFKIIYEVTATTPGAKYYFNPIRKGSIATDESVFDRATGKPLTFDVVGQAEASAGGVPGRDSSQTYIRVALTRPVPANGGEARVLIVKTYEDAKSYYVVGDTIVFTRGLGIKRNAVVLPVGYEIVSSNFPSQVRQEADGRVGISFWNNTPSEAAVMLKAVPVRGLGAAKSPMAARFDERAHQNREIVYDLLAPESHAFALYHDYTESRPGTSVYINEVRAGSSVSKPSARNLDTGDTLSWQVLKGNAITGAGLQVPNQTTETEIVAFRFPPVKPGESTRIRMFETYTDTARYKLVGDELVWDRSFGRPSNIVILPSGWVLTNSSIPATVSTQADGRVRLEFINPRPDDIAVLITARRRSPSR
jgi:hypothetical protein